MTVRDASPSSPSSDAGPLPRSELHVIFGAGQIGPRLAGELLAMGHRVRQVRRGPPGAPRPGLDWVRADATDPAAAAEAARGADVVYDCTNPAQYHRWDELLPPLRRGVLRAASAAGARLVVLDCLYMYGRPTRAPFDEDEPMRPCSRKGELRAQLARELFEAHARGDVRATTGRASDFFGPDTPMGLLGNRALERLAAGKPVEVLGDPDQPHSFNFSADVARGLAVLGTHQESLGKVWHLPATWSGTTRELVQAMAAALGRPGTLRTIPDWLLRAIGLVRPEYGAAAEMTYQWKLPYLLDDRRFRAAFGVEPTPVAEAMEACARWVQERAGARAA
jgi:nucleoside-diphosphate-sugar epimerase